jgi:hypothetical protein
MAKRFRKPAPKKAKRINHDHGGVPQLAAQLSGKSVWTVYGVIYGRFKSARVERAIAEAERQLHQAKRRAA